MAKQETVSISKIKNNPNNPRTIKDDKFHKLVKSIKEFPEMLDKRPIVVNAEMIVLGGNMRLKACREAGLKEVPVIIAEDWTEDQQRQFIIKDNVSGGEWDWDMLANEWNLEELDEWGLDLPDFNINDLGEAPEEGEFDAEPPVEPVTVLGDLYELNSHRVHCADSTSSDAVAKLMNGIKATMVFTDPPYNVDYGNIKHPKFKQRSIENDNMSIDDFKDFCRGFAGCIELFCDGIIYCWAGPGPDGRAMFTILDEMFHCSTTIVWNKDQFTLGRGKYQNKYEPCWFGWNKSGVTFTEDRKLTNVWDFERPKKSELHPTMKPLQVVTEGINHSSSQGDVVLDLFLGSGSTLIASEQVNRKCYGQELDPKYCDVIVRRWLKYMRDNNKSYTVKRNGEVLSEEELNKFNNG